jgi:hypothetical protein
LRAGRGIVELAVARAVKETLPLMTVEHEHPLLRVTRHAHQHPLPWGGGGRDGRIADLGKGDLDGAVATARAVPDLRGEVDTEGGNGGLGRHGFLATPQ